MAGGNTGHAWRVARAGNAVTRTRRPVSNVEEPTAHPLDPLTADEISEVAAILRSDRGVEPPRWRFASIELVEPAKGAPGPAEREAQTVCWNREDGRACRAVVSLTGAAVTVWEPLGDGQQPNMTVDEWHEADGMLRAHPRLIAA